MGNVLMQCGCVSQGTNGKGEPVCVIHHGFIPEAFIVQNEKPSLEGRKAKCTSCHKEPVDSLYGLPFFEYKGPGSWTAINRCNYCGWFKDQHPSMGGTGCYKNSNNPLPALCERKDNMKFLRFKPLSQGEEFDSYYDGCYGWD